MIQPWRRRLATRRLDALSVDDHGRYHLVACFESVGNILVIAMMNRAHSYGVAVDGATLAGDPHRRYPCRDFGSGRPLYIDRRSPGLARDWNGSLDLFASTHMPGMMAVVSGLLFLRSLPVRAATRLGRQMGATTLSLLANSSRGCARVPLSSA